MAQVYFKLINHHDGNYRKVPTFWGINSKVDTNFKQIKNYFMNNVWYDLNAIIKKTQEKSTLEDSRLLSNLTVLYLWTGVDASYGLPWMMYSSFRTKEDADKFQNYSFKEIEISKGGQEQNNYGLTIAMAPTTADIQVNQDGTYWIRYDINNPSAVERNRPVIKLNHLDFSIKYDLNNAYHGYDKLNDIYSYVNDSVSGITYNGKEPLSVDFKINGESNNVTFNPGASWNFNNKLEDNAVIDIITKQSVKPATVTISKDNDSDPYTVTPTKAEVGKPTKITLTANTGYYFTNAYYDINSDFENPEYMTVSDDGLTATFTFTPSDKDDSRVVHAVTKKLTNNTIEFHGENATCSPLEFPLNTDTTITVKPNTGYELVQTYYMYTPDSDNMQEFSSETPEQATTVVNEKLPTTLYVYTTTKKKEEPKPAERKQVPITLNLTHCSADINSLPENDNNKWSDHVTKVVTLTADDGYIFDKDVSYRFYSFDVAGYIQDIKKATNTNKIKIEMMAGPYDELNDRIDRHPSITAVANKQAEPISTGLDSIHLYKMRNAELDNLSNKLVMYYKQSDTGTSYIDTYDYTLFINQVYKMPVEIPPELLKTTDHVSVGVFNLAENTTSITKDTFDLNVGQITVTGKDASDYNVLKATLVLPFINNQTLNINDILNNTITITYRINLLNGSATLVVNNQQGNLITQNYNISTQLQLFGAYYDKNVNTLNSVLNNQIRQAYLVISYKEPVLNLKTYSTNEHGVLKSYKGLTKAINPAISFTCNNAEYSAIVAQLESGVIIK